MPCRRAVGERLGVRHKEELLGGAEHLGKALALLTWVLRGNDTTMVAPGWTVLLSVIAHGVTAARSVGARSSTSR